MNWKEFDSKVYKLAQTDRLTPIQIGDLLNQGEAEFGEQYSQVLNYFPLRKHSTIANWKSICGSVPESIRPTGVRISQMDAVRTLELEQQKEYLSWAVTNDYGREEIQARMLTEGLLIPRRDDAEKFVEAAIKKLDRALPLADEKMGQAIKTAKSVLEDARR
jgi:hypothetical protein